MAYATVSSAVAASPLVWAYVICPVIFFLIGSIPFGFLAGKLNGIDLRQHGSGNIGATNAFRVLGKGWGIAAFAGDFFKGFVPLLVLRAFTANWEPGNASQGLFLVAALSSILGHNFTPWLGFKGGKGIATSAGVLAALIPWTFGVSLSVWIILVLITRTVSIASIAACVALPIATAFFYRGEWLFFAFSMLAGILGIWRHRANIARLRAGTELKMGQSKPQSGDKPEPGQS